MEKVTFIHVIISVLISNITGDVPGCDYYDTVDLTNSTKFENGSYQFENILIPKEKTGQYNYAKLWESKEKMVAEHTRGCICHIKSCVRFCCDRRKLLVDDEDKCHKELKDYDLRLNVTEHTGVQIEVNVSEKYIIQQHFEVPCRNHFHLDADNNADEGWTLYENGTLYRHHDNKSFGKMDYCLQPHKLDNGMYKTVPHQCSQPKSMTFIYIQGVSGIFMICTIVLHLSLPEFRLTHYKCLTFYFTCLTLTFFLLRIEDISILRPLTNSKIPCCAIACLGYYAVMASFLWLLIINYNLWKQIRSSGIMKVSFIRGNIFVWSVAGVLLLITSSVDYLLDSEEEGNLIWRPRIFAFYTCWIDTEHWSAMIYYYGPLLILLLFNITFFTLTAKGIIVDNRRNQKVKKEMGSKQTKQTNANFMTFVLYFITAGLIWILEIVAYLMPRDKVNWIDYITSSQGIIIFAATVRSSINFRLTQHRNRVAMDKYRNVVVEYIK